MIKNEIHYYTIYIEKMFDMNCRKGTSGSERSIKNDDF